jgi:hypothetical protein
MRLHEQGTPLAHKHIQTWLCLQSTSLREKNQWCMQQACTAPHVTLHVRTRECMCVCMSREHHSLTCTRTFKRALCTSNPGEWPLRKHVHVCPRDNCECEVTALEELSCVTRLCKCDQWRLCDSAVWGVLRDTSAQWQRVCARSHRSHLHVCFTCCSTCTMK